MWRRGVASQRPILLHGHDKPLTLVKYNADGDLLFSSAKDKAAVVWRSDTGERIGTYDGHRGAVWSLDVTRKCRNHRVTCAHPRPPQRGRRVAAPDCTLPHLDVVCAAVCVVCAAHANPVCAGCG